MSGGPIHLGILSDEAQVARIRPEASKIAARHSGFDMNSVFNHSIRPSTAPHPVSKQNRKYSGPLPGFENEIVGTSLSTVPRVKPEASEIARKSQGQIGSILKSVNPRPQVQTRSNQGRPQTAPPLKGPIISNQDKTITPPPPPPRVKSEAADTAALGTTGLIGKLFAESMDAARRKNIENSLKEQNKPKNHIQINIQRMKKIQKESREKRNVVN